MRSIQIIAALVLALVCINTTARAQNKPAKKPNILIIWGDDIGQFNISAYNMV